MIEVLIIEDDPRVAEINRRFLEKTEGYQLIGMAKNGQEGLEKLEIMQPHLVLLDVFLPDFKGTELIWKIRTELQDTDIIMITAAGEMDTIQEALRGGIFDYLVKPVMFERFTQSLENYRKYRKTISQSKRMDQSQLDTLIFSHSAPSDFVPLLPKGIDRITLNKVLQTMKQNSKKGLTAEQVGTQLGVSRTTARRYLEYLVSIQKLQTDQRYGTIGRPERKFLWIS
ncbi:response regulator [Shimazuella kribbensis]|uniref:response regulator n=1 Tax=Shimazuella kribbensis TaxID=139808 RepID=UPI0004079BBD|nr:response regulator [Shimazuella kribbensis]